MSTPRLDIRHLAMIDAVARLGSICGAAHSLGLTQPALSRQLQEAERRLGVEYVQRSGRQMQLSRISMRPNASIVCLTTRSTLSRSARSAAIAIEPG